MIRITIGNGDNSLPEIVITQHATGQQLWKVFPIYRTRRTGRWRGHGTRYYTPEDRQNLLNEARQFADGFAEGVRYATTQISRVDDNQPVVDYRPDEPYAVRQHEESLRHATTG
jgi:chlorite dismutase